jgi:hypothetical protein
VLFEARHSTPRQNRLLRFPVDSVVSTHAPRAARKARHLKTRCLFSSVLTIKGNHFIANKRHRTFNQEVESFLQSVL